MKQLYTYIIFLAALLPLFSACTEKEGVLDVTIVAKDGVNTKSHLDNNYVAWDNGDQININGIRYTVSLDQSSSTATISGVEKDPENKYRAVFPASITGTHVSSSSYGVVTFPTKQTYSSSKVDIPMVANSTSGATLNFYAIASLLKITVQGTTTVRSIVVSSTANLSGSGRIRGTSSAPLFSIDNGCNYVILDCGDSVSVSGSKDFYVVVPAVTAKFTVTVNTTDKASNGEYLSYTRTQAGTATIGRSQMGDVFFNLSDATQVTSGVLFGKFTVNSSGKKVRFSKGNLQYDCSTQEWGFAESQSTIIGSLTNLTSGKMDLFGWATGDNPLRIDILDSLYYNSDIASGSIYDWGHNAISNGGNFEDMWTVLTRSEWDYLINQRSGDRFILAIVDGKRGIILLPDDYVHPSNLSAMTDVNSTDRWINHNEVRWGRMQAAGAVFLPLAGEREEESVTESDNSHPWCYYWSLTRYSRTSAYGQKISSTGRGGVTQTNISKHLGNPVRLVQIVSN